MINEIILTLFGLIINIAGLIAGYKLKKFNFMLVMIIILDLLLISTF